LQVSRRRFFQLSGIGLGWLAVRPVLASGSDSHRIALLADTHIPDSANARGPHDCEMTQRLRSAIQNIIGLEPRPACAVIVGDLAWKTGTAAEYAMFAEQLQPLRKIDMPIHLALGNHDNRETFFSSLKELLPRERRVENKHVLIIELPRADLIVLDSLESKHAIPGECGKAQLQWLASALARNPNKPAITMVHHHPQWPQAKEETIGLIDTSEPW